MQRVRTSAAAMRIKRSSLRWLGVGLGWAPTGTTRYHSTSSEGGGSDRRPAGSAEAFTTEEMEEAFGSVMVDLRVDKDGATGSVINVRGKPAAEKKTSDAALHDTHHTAEEVLKLVKPKKEDQAQPVSITAPDRRENPFGDTPEMIVDMMRARLEELKDERLQRAMPRSSPKAEMVAPQPDESGFVLPQRLKFADEAALDRGIWAPTPKKITSTATVDSEDHDVVVPEEDRLLAFDADAARTQVDEALRQEDVKFESILRKELNRSATGLGSDFSSTSGEGTGSSPESGVKLLRAVQRAGLCSRRAAVMAITGGKIQVDGKVETNPFRTIQAENDVKAEGHKQRLRFAAPRLWMLHKPANILARGPDPKGEKRMFKEYAAYLGVDHVIPVGGLHYRSNGALLLTNDGELARFLEHPLSNIQSTYSFRVKPAIDAVLAHQLNTKGVDINGVRYKNVEFTVFGYRASKYQIRMKVRGPAPPPYQILQHLDRQVIRGGRISTGPYGLKKLPPGHIREVAVPPFFLRRVSAVWTPFVERDWPYFRKIRLRRLKHLAKHRLLHEKEREELDTFSYDQLMESLSHQGSALQAESELVSQMISERPYIGGDVAEGLDVAATIPGMGLPGEMDEVESI